MKKDGRTARGFWEQSRLRARRSPGLTAIYVVLRVIVITMLVLNILQKEYESAFICGLALVLFLVPSILERRLRIDIPSVMEVVILLFIFAAEILGELESYYLQYPYWDTMLHTVNGFLCAAVGFSLIDILTRNKQEKFRLSPLYVALVAFCFSMTIGVLWEFFEWSADLLLGLDMQKDTVLTGISSVMLHPNGKNDPVAMEGIRDVILILEDGTQVKLGLDGYLDIGLMDTMKDLLVNLIGAVVFSVIGYFYVKTKGEGRIAKMFIPQVEQPKE